MGLPDVQSITNAIRALGKITENTTIQVFEDSFLVKESGPEDILNQNAIPVGWLVRFYPDKFPSFIVDQDLVAYMLKYAPLGDLRKNWGWM